MSDNPSLRLDRYELRERIGAGGTARVYKAYDTTLDRLVAIKILYEHLAEDAAFQERFEREARMVAAFNHPNIVQVYDFNVQRADDRAVYYMVMSYIPGHTLRQEIEGAAARRATLPYRRVLTIMRDLAAALGYAHEHGMVHRDVKPGNILIRPDGGAVLTDFGIARMIRAERLTQQGVTSGTPIYMSPEQAGGEAGDERSDLYALGIMFYEMLTGQPPFADENNLSVMLKHMNAPVPPLPPLPDAPDLARLNGFIARALAKNPGDRYQTARAFIAALDAISSAQPDPIADDATSVLIPVPAKGRTTGVNLPVSELNKRTTLGLPILTPPSRRTTRAFLLIGAALALTLIAVLVLSIPLDLAPPMSGTSSMTDGSTSVSSMTDNIYFNAGFTPDDPTNTRWTPVENDMLIASITEDGFLRIENRLANRAVTSIVASGVAYTSVSLSMDAQLHADSAQASAYGLVFRYQDEDNYNVFAVDGVGRYSIWVREAGIWRELRAAGESWTPDESVRAIGQTNRLSVTILGDEFTAYVNSRRVTRVTDPTFGDGGAIGVYVASDDGTATVLIDQFRVFSSVPSMTSPTG
jgi:serine/threonine protein kinase